MLLQVHDRGPVEGPIVVLLHGFPQHAGCWDGVLPGLHDLGLRTLAVNQRGYGQSSAPDNTSEYALDRLVRDVLAVIDAGGATDVVLVGHDWGAIVAWAVAAVHPQRVSALVAVSVPHPRAFGGALRESADQQARSAYIQLFRDPDKAASVLLTDDARRLRAMFAGVPPDRINDYVTPLLAPGALIGPLRWYAAMLGPEFAQVPAVGVPTTFVWSDADVAVSRDAADACATWVTGTYARVDLSGISHWVPDQAPQAVVDAVSAHLPEAAG
ncbi:MAG: alpha/beta fold hydrolase [Rhodoferax sp.]|nr:alpha/beta fold hydrolase [Actinomycetota bacterium]